jgi:uncharacterized membrane protein YqjE
MASLWSALGGDSPPAQPAASGSLDTVRRLLGTTVALARIRLELLGLELQLERHRWVCLLWWGSLGAWLAAAGLGLAATGLSFSLWPSQPGRALGAAGLILLALAGLCAACLRHQLRRMEPPLGLSVQQWRDDHSALAPSPCSPQAEGLSSPPA